MLVILLNVSLNTLPVLAFRVIYQALKKPQRKVRGGVHATHGGPQQPEPVLGTGT